MAKKDVFALIGVPEAIKKLRRMKDAIPPAVEASVIEAAHILLRESLKLCPIDTGDLRRSGEVIVNGSGLSTTAIVAYTQQYAIYVHENLEAYHKPPTQAKFLEQPMRQYRRDIAKKIARDVRHAIMDARGTGWMNRPPSKPQQGPKYGPKEAPRVGARSRLRKPGKNRVSVRKRTTSRLIDVAGANKRSNFLSNRTAAGKERRKAYADKLRAERKELGSAAVRRRVRKSWQHEDPKKNWEEPNG